MIDLSPIILFLNGLGPWGVVAGAGLVLLVQWLRSRNSNPTPTPAPTPVLDALLNFLKLHLTQSNTPAAAATTASTQANPDIDTATVEKLLNSFIAKKAVSNGG